MRGVGGGGIFLRRPARVSPVDPASPVSRARRPGGAALRKSRRSSALASPEALRRTLSSRPDLLERCPLTEEERAMLDELERT